MINQSTSKTVQKAQTDDIGMFFAQDIISISISRNINKTQSKFIFDRVQENKEDFQINWTSVMKNFECADGSPKDLLKKIRNHYYNKQAKEKKIKLRKMKRIIRKLSIFKFKLIEKIRKLKLQASNS